MEDEVFEKYLEKLIEEFYPFGAEYYDPDKIEEKEKIQVRKILEEVYQLGKDNKFKDIGYIDVDKYYPEDKKEAKP